MINNIIPCIGYTLSCIFTPIIAAKPESKIVNLTKLFFITLSLIITEPKAELDIYTLIDFYTSRSLLAATVQHLIPIFDIILTIKAIK